MDSALKCITQIKDSTHIAIITHQNADADALCSSIALKRLIKKNFETDDKKYDIDIFTDTENMPELYNPITKDEPINQQNFKRYDLAISLDVPTRARLGKFDSIFRYAKDSLNIDHHETNTKFAKNNIIAFRCSSTCEIIYQFFVKIEHLKNSNDILSLLYSGIITDTNNLTQNLGANTLKVVSEIMQICKKDNLDLNSIRDYFFKNDKKEKLSLLSRALDSITFSPDGKVAIMKIVKQDFIETNTTIEDTLGIVNYAINLQGVDIGVIFIKQDDNSYYVSLRSKGNIDVGEIAKSFNGGGHENVAAFNTKPEDSLTDIKSKLLSLCNQQFEAKAQSTASIEDMFVEVKGDGPKEEEIASDSSNTNQSQTTNTLADNDGETKAL